MVKILPSIMCADLTNLQRSLEELETIGLDTVHVDILDGHFSPSMPIGCDIIKQIKSVSKMKCDVHIMTNNNEFFINEALNNGAEAVTFHYESSSHVDRLMNLIKSANAKVGVALNPATSLTTLDYVLPYCDIVMLMLINPGFAGHAGEKQVPYALKKVEDLRNLIQSTGLSAKVFVDGRVSMETIENLVSVGAEGLVAGSTSLFRKGNSLADNKIHMEELIKKGQEK